MTTQGDRVLDVTLAKIGGKGLFVKELEVALAEGRADIAVHSAKDVPMALAEGFRLAAILPREDPRDAFVSTRYGRIEDLPGGAIVGTSSLRREAQLRARFPGLDIRPLRGNLDTRLAKLDRGDYDAIVLAVAGLTRLGLAGRIRTMLDPADSLPAAGQGALAIEIRADRPDLVGLLAPLNDASTDACVRAERTVSRSLAGSCQVPLAAFAVIEGETLWLRGLVASPDGKQVARGELRAPVGEAERAGTELAALLRTRGADEILARLEA